MYSVVQCVECKKEPKPDAFLQENVKCACMVAIKLVFGDIYII